jgi:hypothetical protein
MEHKYCIMRDTKTPTPSIRETPVTDAKKPQEKNNIVVQAHVKIHDPVSKKIYFEGRA